MITPTKPENTRKDPIPDEILSHSETETTLSDRQLLAIELLASGANFQTTSDRVNVDPKTLYKWRQNPAFHSHLALRREETLGQASDHYRSLLIDTLNILFKQAQHPYAPTSHRAARSLLALSRLGHHLVPPTHNPPPK